MPEGYRPRPFRGNETRFAPRVQHRLGTAGRDESGNQVAGEYNWATGTPEGGEGVPGGPGQPMTRDHQYDSSWPMFDRARQLSNRLAAQARANPGPPAQGVPWSKTFRGPAPSMNYLPDSVHGPNGRVAQPTGPKAPLPTTPTAPKENIGQYDSAGGQSPEDSEPGYEAPPRNSGNAPGSDVAPVVRGQNLPNSSISQPVIDSYNSDEAPKIGPGGYGATIHVPGHGDVQYQDPGAAIEARYPGWSKMSPQQRRATLQRSIGAPVTPQEPEGHGAIAPTQTPYGTVSVHGVGGVSNQYVSAAGPAAPYPAPAGESFAPGLLARSQEAANQAAHPPGAPESGLPPVERGNAVAATTPTAPAQPQPASTPAMAIPGAVKQSIGNAAIAAVRSAAAPPNIVASPVTPGPTQQPGGMVGAYNRAVDVYNGVAGAVNKAGPAISLGSMAAGVPVTPPAIPTIPTFPSSGGSSQPKPAPNPDAAPQPIPGSKPAASYRGINMPNPDSISQPTPAAAQPSPSGTFPNLNVYAANAVKDGWSGNPDPGVMPRTTPMGVLTAATARMAANQNARPLPTDDEEQVA